MDAEKDQAATSALALGTLFADDTLRKSVDAYIDERMMQTFYMMLKTDHPLMRELADYAARCDVYRHDRVVDRLRREEEALRRDMQAWLASKPAPAHPFQR